MLPDLLVELAARLGPSRPTLRVPQHEPSRELVELVRPAPARHCPWRGSALPDLLVELAARLGPSRPTVRVPQHEPYEGLGSVGHGHYDVLTGKGNAGHLHTEGMRAARRWADRTVPEAVTDSEKAGHGRWTWNRSFYDDTYVPRVKGARRSLRADLASKSRALLTRYRRGARVDPDTCPLRAALRNAVDSPR